MTHNVEQLAVSSGILCAVSLNLVIKFNRNNSFSIYSSAAITASWC